jgi:hypothetical protein
MAGVNPEPETGGLVWRKSTLSSVGNCVEVAGDGDHVVVRDSKDRSGAVLRYTRSEWTAFIGGVKQLEFDDPA